MSRDQPTWFFGSNVPIKSKHSRRMYLDSSSLKSLFDEGLPQNKRKSRFRLKGRLKQLKPSPIDISEVPMPNNQAEQVGSSVTRQKPILGKSKNTIDAPLSLVVSDDEAEKELQASQLGISLEEFESLEAILGNSDADQQKITDQYRRLFEECDADGSGAISRDELRTLIQSSDDTMDDGEIEELLVQADTDGDGEIDFEEFVELMKARRRLIAVAQKMSSTPGSKTTATSLCTEKESLPPLKFVPRRVRRRARPSRFNRYYGRNTPKCLRPGNQVDVTALRRELALSEYGLKKLDGRLKDNVQWIQQNCPVTSIKAQLFTKKWGAEKMDSLLKRIHLNFLSRAFRQWMGFNIYCRNKEKANLYLKCKGSRKVKTMMSSWGKKKMFRAWNAWNTEVARQAREECESAAVELQRVSRSYIGRVRAIRFLRNRAAKMIQKIVRGHIQRKLVIDLRTNNLRHRSACVLQRAYRGYTGRQLSSSLYQAQHRARSACKIQRCFRRHRDKKFVDVMLQQRVRGQACLKIQCQARRIFATQRALKLREECRRNAAVIKIQSIQRGRLSRQKRHLIRKEHTAVTNIQRQFRGMRVRRNTRAVREHRRYQMLQIKRYKASLRIQSAWRGHSGRYSYHVKLLAIKERKRQEHIFNSRQSIKIQATWRGHCGRTRSRLKRHERAEKLRLASMHNAALRIQLRWRMHRGQLALHMRLRARAALDEEERLAATKIQAAARGQLGRVRFRDLQKKRRKDALYARLHRESAIIIQSAARGKLQRIKYKKQRDGNRSHAAIALRRLVDQNREDAAIRIQCCVRGFLSRQSCKKRLEEHAMAKRNLEIQAQERKAAIVIQCHLRKKRAQLEMRRKKREFQERLKTLAMHEADEEIAKLKQQQAEELAAMRLQLILEKDAAEKEAIRLKKEVEAHAHREKCRQEEDHAKLAQLKMQSILESSSTDAVLKGRQKERDQERRENAAAAEKLRLDAIAQEKLDEEARQVAAAKLSALLEEAERKKTANAEAQRREYEARAAREALRQEDLRKENAVIQIQGFVRHKLSKIRIQRVKAQQRKRLLEISDAEERLRVEAEQQRQLAESQLKALLDEQKADKASAERQLRLERERLEIESERKNRLRDVSARRIQALGHGYLARKKIRALKTKIAEERRIRDEEDAKALERIRQGESEPYETGGKEDEWVEYWDENAQSTYYFNVRTQEASWTRPAQSFEAVSDSYDTAGTTTDYHDDNTSYATYENPYQDNYGFYDEYGEYHYYEYSQPDEAYASPQDNYEWEQHYDENSRSYYYNRNTGETRWAE